MQSTSRATAGGAATATRTELVRAFDRARESGDGEAMAAAALALAATHEFGTFAGRVPAYLFEAYSRSEGESRARLAVALARAWAYGNDPARAVRYADEALADAEARGDPAALAAALDAQLLVHWGPDQLAERRRMAVRLEDAVAHLSDVEARLSAHLWRLTTALESLEIVIVRRQLRALDVLAAESGDDRVRFFAASRRGMYALLIGDLTGARSAREAAAEAGAAAGEADTFAIERTLAAGIARQRDDRPALASEAAMYEEFGLGEAVTSIAAEGASLWVAAGEVDRAAALLHQLAGAEFGGIARDVDWLLSMTSLTDVAIATGARELVEAAARSLAPYAGRGVVNAGGVAFAGVVDDVLGRALRELGRDDEARARTSEAALAYRRMGATWWLGRLAPAAAPRSEVVHLRPGDDGIWWVGRDGAVGTLREMKGLRYLALILDRPGLGLSASELSDAVAGHPGTGPVTGDSGPLLDRRALRAYRDRLAEIDADLDDPDTGTDPLRVAALQDQRDALLGELRAATGLGGRARVSGGSGERARVAVRKAIAAAIERVSSVDPSLGRLLRDTVATGAVCRYDPDPDRPIRWVLAGEPGRAPDPRRG